MEKSKTECLLLLFGSQEKVIVIPCKPKREVLYRKCWWCKQFAYAVAKCWNSGSCWHQRLHLLSLYHKKPFSCSPPLCTLWSPSLMWSSVLLCGPAHFSLTACSKKLNTFIVLFMQLPSPQMSLCVWIFSLLHIVVWMCIQQVWFPLLISIDKYGKLQKAQDDARCLARVRTHGCSFFFFFWF